VDAFVADGWKVIAVDVAEDVPPQSCSSHRSAPRLFTGIALPVDDGFTAESCVPVTINTARAWTSRSSSSRTHVPRLPSKIAR
jgi:hypothetical protein